MKLPKTISICGVTHKLITNPKHNGGTWDSTKKTIEIGTLCPAEVPEILLHEIIEASLSTRDVRFALEREDVENGDLIFVFNHKDFEQVIKDVACSLKGLSFR